MRMWLMGLVGAVVLVTLGALPAGAMAPADAPVAAVAAGGDAATLEKQRADIDQELRDIEKKKTERRKAIEESKPVTDAKRALETAEAAYQDFVKNNPDYAKLAKARDEAAAAYRKAIEDAKTADPDYTALRKQTDDARAKRAEIDKKANEARQK
jgi:chromosome segregation ATPase